MATHEWNGMKLAYGECPKCGARCQPDYGEDEASEWVVCCECQIGWNLYHDDPDDPRDGTQPWRLYRIDEVGTFYDIFGGIEPYECEGIA